MTQFYVLTRIDFKEKSKEPDNEFCADDPVHQGKVTGNCPQCNTGGLYDWLPPYSLEISVYRCSAFADAMFGTTLMILVNENFKNSYERTDLKGLTFRGKVTVTKVKCLWGARKKSLPPLPNFYLTEAERGTTAIDHEKSGSVFELNGEPECHYCRYGNIMRIQRLVVDESTWDGRDIFQINGTGRIVVTQKFKDWFDSHHFAGLRLIPAEEFSFDLYWGLTPEEYAKKT